MCSQIITPSHRGKNLDQLMVPSCNLALERSRRYGYTKSTRENFHFLATPSTTQLRCLRVSAAPLLRERAERRRGSSSRIRVSQKSVEVADPVTEKGLQRVLSVFIDNIYVRMLLKTYSDRHADAEYVYCTISSEINFGVCATVCSRRSAVYGLQSFVCSG